MFTQTFLSLMTWYKKPRQTYFITKVLDILLDLLSEFSKRESSINRRLKTTPYFSVIGWTQEKCSWESLFCFISNNSVLYTFIHTIAPGLHKETWVNILTEDSHWFYAGDKWNSSIFIAQESQNGLLMSKYLKGTSNEFNLQI